MLTRILHNSPELCTFVDQLNLKLSVPQRRHVINLADALLVTDAHKTLAEIQRQFVSCVDPSNIADTFRIAPWSAEDIRSPLAALLMQTALQRLERQDQPRRLLINLDDSLAIKDADTRQLEGVDWHYDPAAKRRKRASRQNALAYLLCNIIAGDWNFTFAIQPYLRAQTVRRINRHRRPEQRLHFVCKGRLARQILDACRALIPADMAVYVHFDAWYASADMLSYIRKQGWHATCRVRAKPQVKWSTHPAARSGPTAQAVCPRGHSRCGRFENDLSGTRYGWSPQQGPLRRPWVGIEKAPPGSSPGVLYQYGSLPDPPTGAAVVCQTLELRDRQHPSEVALGPWRLPAPSLRGHRQVLHRRPPDVGLCPVAFGPSAQPSLAEPCRCHPATSRRARLRLASRRLPGSPCFWQHGFRLPALLAPTALATTSPLNPCSNLQPFATQPNDCYFMLPRGQRCSVV